MNITNDRNLTNATTPPSGYYPLHDVVTIYAKTSIGGYTFLSWSGYGPGNYTGSDNNDIVTMNGSIEEVANYEFSGSTTTLTTTVTTSTTSSATSSATSSVIPTTTVSHTIESTTQSTTQATTTVNSKQYNAIPPTGNDETSNAITVPYNISSKQTNSALSNNYSIGQKSIIAEVASHENLLDLVIGIMAATIVVLVIVLILDLRKKAPKNPNDGSKGNTTQNSK